MKKLARIAVVAGSALLAAGCAGGKVSVVQEELPTIAHVHIGHTITAWKHTPGEKGLFQVAEEEAGIALAHARFALESPGDLESIQLHTGHVLHAIAPQEGEVGPGLGFGLERAMNESASHLTFAAQSDDASENVQRFAPRFQTANRGIQERCGLIVALGEDILASDSAPEAAGLAQEVESLARANLEGDGSRDPGGTGLQGLRQEIADMIAREVPAYSPVERKYLFGVIRLSSGKWVYAFQKKPSQTVDDTGHY